MKVFNLSNIVKNKLHIIMFLAVLLGVILISIAFLFVFGNKEEGRKIKNNIFNLTSYYADYNVTVTSNKTVSTHNIKEFYKKENELEYFRFNYKDFMQNDYSLIIKNGNAIMKNTLQIAKYVTKIEERKENLYSLATYIDMINLGVFKVECSSTEVTTSYSIYINEVLNDEEAKKYSNIINSSLGIDKITLHIIANKPQHISITSKDNEIIKIEYIEFNQDEELDLNVFEV